LKCLFNIYPGTIVGGTLALVITICAYLLRLFELPLLKHMPSTYYTLDAYFNAIYCTIITITTVGYGDIAPKSDLGKVVMMFAALVGALLVSLVVVMVSSSLELSRNQMKVFRQVQAQTAASKVIVRAIKYYQAKKNYYLHKLAKNPMVKEKSWFLQAVKEKKQWQIYINPSYSNFSRRRLNDFAKLDERMLIEDMNKRYLEMVDFLNDFSMQNKFYGLQKFDKNQQILDESKIIKNEVLDMVLMVEELRELTFVQELKIDALMDFIQHNVNQENQHERYIFEDQRPNMTLQNQSEIEASIDESN
jgi:hypothetical protein